MRDLPNVQVVCSYPIGTKGRFLKAKRLLDKNLATIISGVRSFPIDFTGVWGARAIRADVLVEIYGLETLPGCAFVQQGRAFVSRTFQTLFVPIPLIIRERAITKVEHL